MGMDIVATRSEFRRLHEGGTFLIPNPFDQGSARILHALGFAALATTSSGFAATLGRLDMSISRDELVGHVALLSAATPLPLNVDAERCFAETLGGVSETITLLVDAGASGISIEDWNPTTNAIDHIATATERVAAAKAAAAASGTLLTARAENFLHGVRDLDDTIARLVAYRDAGADVVYAPGLTDLAQIEQVVRAAQVPVNVLLLPGGPTVSDLASVGVRRVSVGGALARIAHGAVAEAASALLATGQFGVGAPFLDSGLVRRAFAP
jgi:2-methylisocitrate lyase-like PEP mutase family enzyme